MHDLLAVYSTDFIRILFPHVSQIWNTQLSKQKKKKKNTNTQWVLFDCVVIGRQFDELKKKKLKSFELARLCWTRYNDIQYQWEKEYKKTKHNKMIKPYGWRCEREIDET